MDSQRNITVLLQPGPQTDPSFSNQNKNVGVEDNFQDVFEEATHKVKQTENSASSETNQQKNQDNQQSTESNPAQTQAKKTEIKSEPQNPQNSKQDENPSFENDLAGAQKPENFGSASSIHKGPNPYALTTISKAT